MADRKLVKYKIVIGLALASSIFVYSQITLAYSTLTTHRAITNESAKFFNTYYSTQEIPLDQINSLTKGSADEDTPPRWLNHFYDPVHQAGFRGLRSSKAWAEDTSAQAGWVNKNPLAEYFSASGDYSWERAIYDYVYADKNRAMEALGHTLHLIQDATVPDHTRDDAHPIWSTYESYAKQFEMANTNLSDKLINQKQSPIIFANLSEYFDYLARFSNNNFFSDDTILYSGYPKPVIDKEIIEKLSDGKNYKFGVNDLGKLSLIHESFNKNSGDIEKTYTMIDVDQKIPSDYWLNLSPKATLASAGVIKLFFDEVEKEKQSKKLFEKNKSLAENFLENLNGKLGGLLAGVALVNSSPNPSSSTPSLVATTSDIIATTTEEAIMLETNQTEIDRLYENLQKLKIQLEQIIAERLSQGAQSLVATTTQTLANTRQIISGGGSSFTSAIEDITNPTISSDAIVIPSPIIISPVDFSQSFATTSIIFSGTSLPGLVIFVFDNLNKIQATTSDTGEWTLTLVNLRQGSSTIKFFARDENGNASLPTEVNFNINSLPLAINFSINDCAQSLASDFCLLKPTSTLSFAWAPTKAGDYRYELMRETYYQGDWIWEKMLETNDLTKTMNTDLANDALAEINWQVIARSASSSEVVASSSEITTFFHPRPIVINEIGWAGTVASGFDEWLELKSCFHDYSIDLSSYYLTDSQRSENWRINLTDKILPKGYYLIERGDDNVISNRPKNLVESFITNSGSKAFNLASIGLKLWHKTNLGDELVDETPVWNKAGSASSSLERTFENKISTELSTWEDNFWCYDNESPCALDRNATTTFGTPGQKNKASTAYQS